MEGFLFSAMLVALPGSVVIGVLAFVLFAKGYISRENTGTILAVCSAVALSVSAFLALHPHL